MFQVTYRYLLNFILANLDKLDDLMALAAELTGAQTASERLDVLYKIGKLFLSAEQPSTDQVSAFGQSSIDDLEAKVCLEMSSKGYSAQAWDGSRLRNLFDTLLPALVQLLPILLAAK